jgi:hypothetical protein
VNNTYFYADGDHSSNDGCVDTCIVWDRINFYGIPKDFTEKQLQRIDEGDYKNATKLGTISGCLILCKEILEQGEDPLEVCDDANGDLEYTISALSDVHGPLNVDDGDPFQDVYYIHEFIMESDFNQVDLKHKILNELPDMVLDLFHVRPSVLAFYPAPLEYESDKVKGERDLLLHQIAADKVDSVIGKASQNNISNDKNNISKFSDAYEFTDDEINIVMGRRNSGSTYPVEAKDKTEFDFYEANGFAEMDDSRLLYKLV